MASERVPGVIPNSFKGSLGDNVKVITGLENYDSTWVFGLRGTFQAGGRPALPSRSAVCRAPFYAHARCRRREVRPTLVGRRGKSVGPRDIPRRPDPAGRFVTKPARKF